MVVLGTNFIPLRLKPALVVPPSGAQQGQQGWLRGPWLPRKSSAIRSEQGRSHALWL